MIVPELLAAGVKVRVYDPLYYKGSERLSHAEDFNGVEWSKDAYQAMNGADAAVILTEWNEFRALDLGQLKSALNVPSGFKPLLVDLRNIYKPSEMEGIDYVSIGRGRV